MFFSAGRLSVLALTSLWMTLMIFASISSAKTPTKNQETSTSPAQTASKNTLKAKARGPVSNLSCYSNSGADAYFNSKGQWSLTGDLRSPHLLKDVELKLKQNTQYELVSSSERVNNDSRVHDERVFKLKPDVPCNYELNLPHDLGGSGSSGKASASSGASGSFQASLVLTCDNMYDAKVDLHCRIK